MNRTEFNASLRSMTELFTGSLTPSESEAVLDRIANELLTPQEVAELRGVHVRTVQWWINKQQIPSIRKGKATYVLRSDALRFKPPAVGNPQWSH